VNQGSTIFAQILDFLPKRQFRRFVAKYNGNHRVRSFTCFDQYLCMAFAQLTFRESLRDIECCLRAMNDKLYHMGIRGKISRSTLADANERRDWRIYRDFAQALIAQARELYVGDDFGVQLSETVYALDATIIDLCLSVFPWAKFRRSKGGVKLHTILDLRGAIPTFVAITAAKVHEMQAICGAYSYLLAANSGYSKAYAGVCRQVCEDCEKECRKHDKHIECKACADACAAVVEHIELNYG